MKNVIFYYTGTGNSLWVARNIAEKLGNTELFPIANFNNIENFGEIDRAGLVFPVHIWGVPGKVLRFLDSFAKLNPSYIFAAAVNAGQVSNTLIQMKKLLSDRNMTLSTGFDFKMPSNYIPWGGPGTDEQIRKRFSDTTEKITRIVPFITDRCVLPVEKGPLWQRIVFTAIYKMSLSHVHEMDKSFWVDNNCNGCGICSKVCPADNITLPEGKPVWNRKCEQCLACIQWCPKEAIQYGKKTPSYRRYHQPEIDIKDIIKRGK